MNNEHPITPPLELVEKWRDEALILFPDDAITCPCDIDDARDEYIATRASRWGADAELEACCEWMKGKGVLESYIKNLCSTRRPKPPSLKERALEVLGRVSKDGYPCNYQDDEDWNTIRQALELLPDEAV